MGTKLIFLFLGFGLFGLLDGEANGESAPNVEFIPIVSRDNLVIPLPVPHGARVDSWHQRHLLIRRTTYGRGPNQEQVSRIAGLVQPPFEYLFFHGDQPHWQSGTRLTVRWGSAPKGGIQLTDPHLLEQSPCTGDEVPGIAQLGPPEVASNPDLAHIFESFGLYPSQEFRLTPGNAPPLATARRWVCVTLHSPPSSGQ